MKRFLNKKVVAIGMAAGLVLGGAGAAFAYFTTGGTGSGTDTVGTSADIVVNQTPNANTDALQPGGSVAALSGNFDNTTNPGGVWIHSVTASVTGVTPLANHDNAHNGLPDCTTADFYITGTSTVNAVVAHGTGVGSWSGLNVGMANRDGTANPPSELSPAANQDNCQGASITITYTAHGS